MYERREGTIVTAQNGAKAILKSHIYLIISYTSQTYYEILSFLYFQSSTETNIGTEI